MMNKYLLSAFTVAMLPAGMSVATAQPVGTYTHVGNKNTRQSDYLSQLRLPRVSPQNYLSISSHNASHEISKSYLSSDISTHSVANVQNITTETDLVLTTATSRNNFNTTNELPTSIEVVKTLQITANNLAKELIIIDAAIPDKHLFYQHIKPGVDVIEISSNKDGLVQLNTILSQYQELDSLHVVSHATDGALQLGNSLLDETSFKAHPQLSSALNHALKDGGDLLLYGCELAKTAKGEQLLELISLAANIDVAASNNLTGADNQGGDWELEIQKGDINTEIVFDSIAMVNFNAVLSYTGTVNFDNLPASGYVSSITYTIPATSYNLKFETNNASASLYTSGAGYLYAGVAFSNNPLSTSISFTGGETFSPESIKIVNSAAIAKVVRITSSKGGDVTLNSLSPSAGFEPYTLPATSAWDDVTSITIQYDSGNLDRLLIDDLTLANVAAAAVNTAPIATAPTAPTVVENANNVALADNIQVTDGDGDDQTVTFTITGGTLSTGTTGITFGGSGNGSASFTAAGSLASINAALDAATFTPTPGLSGTNAGTVAFKANDGTEDSNTASVTFDIAVVTPTIMFATYNAITNSLVVTGTNFEANAGATNDVDVSDLTVTGQAGATYTLLSTSDVEIDSSTQFTVTLSGADIAAVEALLNKNGGSAADSTSYNLAGADDFITFLTTGDSSDLIGNSITVSNVDSTAPTVTEVTSVTSPGTDTTPDVTISTNEAGTLTVGGSCGSASEGAIGSGSSTITLTQPDNFTPLAAGTYSDCTVTVTDSSNNTSSARTLTEFIINSPQDNDGSVTAGAGMEATTLSTTIDTVPEASSIFDFIIFDGGTSDGLTLTVSQIIVNVSGTSTDTLRNNITWRLNGPDASNVIGVYDALVDTITFSGLSVSVADSSGETYTVNAYYNDNSNVTEGATFILSTDGDTDFTIGSNSTQFATSSAVTNGSGLKAAVIATKLVFTNQPAGSVSGSALTTQPVIAASDAFGNTDKDFTETITFTESSAGSLTGNSVVAISGVATFTAVKYFATADQQSFTLTANDEDGVGPNFSTVDANSVTSDVVATTLVFDTQPGPLSVNSGEATSFSTIPVVSARDGDGVIDTGYSTNIVLSEVNGTGSATMTATGDIDGSAATTTITPSSGVSTFTGMQITYTASGGSSEPFNLQASSGGLSTVNSSQLTGVVDSTGPTVTSVTVPANATYIAGQNLEFTVNLNEATTVVTTGGTPQLAITVGSTVRQASYVSGSGTSALLFRYTTQTGDADADGIAIGALSANGGTLRDAANNNATLTLNSVGATTAVLVDAAAPSVSSVSVPGNATYIAGQNLDFTVNFDESVAVNLVGGTPQLSLTIGATIRQAVYVSGSGTSALLFRYTVQSGDSDNNGIAVGALSANGGTVRDPAGNYATLSLNSVSSTALITVDALLATVTSVTVPANATYISGQNLDFTVNLTEDITVNTVGGTPQLSLDIGGTTRQATFVSGSGTGALLFRYTVQSGDSDNNGIAVGALSANGGTVRDPAGNDATLSLNSVGSTALVNIDTVAATVSSVIVPANATYISGQNLDFTVNFDESVAVNLVGGTPQLSLTIGATIRQAVYVSGSGTSALLFRYTVQSGDSDNNGIAVGALSANGGTVRDPAGNDATLSLNSVSSTALITVDALLATVTSVTVPANATYISGQNLDFTVNLTEDITVNTVGGTPQLSLDIGGTTRQATFVSGSGTSALLFRYTIQSGDNDNNGIAVGALSANGGTVRDPAGNDATLSLNSVGSTALVTIDAVAATVSSVTVPANATYISGQNLDFTVNFDESVAVNIVGGTPQLAITIGATTRQAVYQSGSGTSALLFRYTIQAGENDSNGIAVDGLSANGATLKDASSNDVTLTLNSVGATALIKVDARAANVTGITLSGNEIASDTSITYTVTFDETVFGIAVTDFAVTRLSGNAMGSVSSVSASSGKSINVIVSSISGSGSIRLDLTGTVKDATGNTTPTYTTGSVHTVNQKPEISGTPETSVAEDSAYSFIPTITGVDVNKVLTFSVINKPAWATFNTLTGALTGTPLQADIGITTGIIITVSDATGATDSLAAFDINVTSTNTAPIIEAQLYDLEEDNALIFTLTAEDADQDELTYVIVSEPIHGSLMRETDNTWIYTPEENYHGTDNFTYKVMDAEAESEPATIEITIAPVNDSPVAQNDVIVLTYNEGGRYALDVLSNDIDVDGDELSLINASSSIGEVSIEAGKLIYQIQGVIEGDIELQYVIDDGNNSNSEAKVTISFDEHIDALLPVITLPDDININASGLFTKVNLGVATAFDSKGKQVPVALVNNITQFSPGVNLVYWQAQDSEGFKRVATQRVEVKPLINIDKDRQGSEGGHYKVAVHLNGESPYYPVTVAYDVSGDADSNDHSLASGSLVINSGLVGHIEFDILNDGIAEANETIIITLDNTMNLGAKSAFTFTITENNIAPQISVNVSQNNEKRTIIDKSLGEVVILSNVYDANNDDYHSYSWLSANGELIDEDSDDNSFTFDPTYLAVGQQKLSLTVSDDGDTPLSTQMFVYFDIVESLPTLTSADSDGDLIPDNIEGHGDADGDGIANYLDTNTVCNVQPADVSEYHINLIETESGICLRRGIHTTNNVSGSVSLRVDEVNSDEDAINIGGLFDFTLYDIPEAGQSVSVVLPQRLPIPDNAIYRKLTSDNNWVEFFVDDNNYYSSAPGLVGFCPPANDSSWTLGLTSGHWCVQVTIEDGGINDDDGVANNQIVDPGGVAIWFNSNTLPEIQSDQIATPQNKAVTINVLVNDSDIDGDILTITSANVDFGTVSVVEQQLYYQPDVNFFGLATINYGVSDGNNGTGYGEVSVTVVENTAPITVNDSARTDDKTAITIDVLANDSDAENDELIITSASAEQGSVVISNNVLFYTPSVGFEGVDTLSYSITDNNGGESQGQVEITLTIKSTEIISVPKKSSGGGSFGGFILLLGSGIFLIRRKSK
ncbi:Ig-like domain-containing protein [Thalassotalea piscium]